MSGGAPIVYDAAYWDRYNGIHHIQLAFVASGAVLFWDGLCTLGELRRSVWPRKWDLSKVAVLWNWCWPRFVHLPICGVVEFLVWTEQSCHRAALLHPFVCIFSLCAAQLILVLRVIAVFSSSMASYGVLGLFFICQIFAVYLPTRLTSQPGVPGCGPRAKPGEYDGLWTIFLPSFVLEFVCLSLVVGKLVWERRNHQTLLYRLCRDDLFYFGSVVTINLANILLIAFDKMPSRTLLWTPCVALTSIITHRCMLDVRSDDLLNFSHFQARPHPDLPTTQQGVKIKMQSHVDCDKDESCFAQRQYHPRPTPSSISGSFMDIEEKDEVAARVEYVHSK